MLYMNVNNLSHFNPNVHNKFLMHNAFDVNEKKYFYYIRNLMVMHECMNNTYECNEETTKVALNK